MIKLKVCGMCDPANIDEVSALNPDFMGFIFYPQSPRFVGRDFNAALPSHVTSVAVFVNETTEVILAEVQKHHFTYVQLHGQESVEQCIELKAYNFQIIKAFNIDIKSDFSLLEPYVNAVDYFLFDAKGKYYGGNAVKFDWSLLSEYRHDIPFFLSGGITPDDVPEIKLLNHAMLFAIDVNSGVELAPAVKDISKINAIKTGLNKNTSL
jgi:phosphoribosylanthranilate isomerase